MPTGNQPIRFGVFEVNLKTGEIRRNGTKVRLQEQPFQVLAALLEKPGAIVTKEELQERIWKDDTFVDFDRSLATAINKVRQALGDSATRPLYVETVPKRGYRFVGLGVERAAPAREPSASRRPWAIIAAVLAILSGAAAWHFSARETTVSWGDPVRVTSDAGLTFQPTISPDGTLLAYASNRDGQDNLDIYVQQIGGGGLVRLTDDPADETSPDFSPDGKSVAFRSERGEGGVYVVPSLGGPERLVAARAHRPRYSPDGEWIAYFESGRGAASPLNPPTFGNTNVVPAVGGTSRLLVATEESSSFPVWSPDSTSVLLIARRSLAPAEWRIVRLDGTAQEVAGSAEALGGLQNRLVGHIPDHWDTHGYVYFSEVDPDSTDLWRIRIDAQSATVVGEPQRILPGTGSFRGASLARSGRLVYAAVEENRDIWSLAIDADRGAARTDEAIRLTDSPGTDGRVQVSQDGSRIVYWSDRSGQYQFWWRDVTAGLDHPTGLIGQQFFVLNAAGTRLVGRVEEGLLSILTLDGIVEKSFPDVLPHGWSTDESRMLVGPLMDNERAMSLMDVESGEQTILLADPEKGFWQGQFSPDGGWITWMTPQDGVQAARLEGARVIPESERIQISEIGPWADKPRWSPNANLIYYTSDRDGFTCIYAQPLDPETKRPQGDLLDIYHSHETQRSISNVGIQDLWMDVARDKIVFEMTELTGNVWMMEPAKGRAGSAR